MFVGCTGCSGRSERRIVSFEFVSTAWFNDRRLRWKNEGFSLDLFTSRSGLLDVAGTIKDLIARDVKSAFRAPTRSISARPYDIRHGDAKGRAA